MSRASALLCVLALVLGGCATSPPREGFRAIAFERERVLERMREVQEQGAGRRSVRAEGSLRVQSPSRSGRFQQVILAERPASLRLEAQNVLGQTLSLLVTDGDGYTFYDGEQLDRGAAAPWVLSETLGLDLDPSEAVDALLVAPVTLRGVPRAVYARDHERWVWTDTERLRFAPNGDLLGYESLDRGGDVRWNVEYTGWRSVPGGRYPSHLTLEFPRTRLRAELRVREVELNAELDPGLFRVADGTQP